MNPTSATTVAVQFDAPIEPGAWTVVTHTDSGTTSCLGYLPGDAGGNRLTSSGDITDIINCLNNVVDPPCEIWQQDINRSLSATTSDVLRVIDLVNGAGDFIVWNTKTLPGIAACP